MLLCITSFFFIPDLYIQQENVFQKLLPQQSMHNNNILEFLKSTDKRLLY